MLDIHDSKNTTTYDNNLKNKTAHHDLATKRLQWSATCVEYNKYFEI